MPYNIIYFHSSKLLTDYEHNNRTHFRTHYYI